MKDYIFLKKLRLTAELFLVHEQEGVINQHHVFFFFFK